MSKNNALSVFEAFSMYLITGAGCLVIGTTLPQIMEHFNISLLGAAGLGSAFAFGRLITVFATGLLTEKFGAKRVMMVGVTLILAFFVGVPLTKSYYLALVLASLAGAGMGAQDSCCPIILARAFPKSYSSALSAGQAFFGAGCFLPPLVMGIVLSNNLYFGYTFAPFATLALVMLALLPFMQIEDQNEHTESAIPKSHHINIKNKTLAYFLLFAADFTYCATINSINLYVTSYAAFLGFAQVIGVNLLTTFNVGSMVGSLIFVFVFRKVHVTTVLFSNSFFATLCLASLLLFPYVPLLFCALFIAGLLLGVIFSILIALATGMNPKKAGLSAALIAVVASSSDTISPIITGNLTALTDIRVAFIYATIMIAITFICGAIYKKLFINSIKERNYR